MCSYLFADENRIDIVRPDAPELAKFGPFPIGVHTIDLINKNQIDVVNIQKGFPIPQYDRPLTVEVWYPANTDKKGGHYPDVFLRDGMTKVTLHGSAVRGAMPLRTGEKFPLIILSHGYPGNRFLMSHMGENLASKGYVVVSIDHTDSLYEKQEDFASTLLNRPLDQKFVLDQMAAFSGDKDHFLYNLIDTDNTGLVGYSMGGYGALITAGAGIAEINIKSERYSPQGILEKVAAESESHQALMDNRFKAIVAIAPWGYGYNLWNHGGLKNINKPIFFMVGDSDETAGYEKGAKGLFDNVINTDRYLLTFEKAGHNTIAPIPAPLESWDATYGDNEVAFTHYADPVWDTLRSNNIANHFMTAYFGKLLKKDEAMDQYLITGEEWKGFYQGKHDGLMFQYLEKK